MADNTDIFAGARRVLEGNWREGRDDRGIEFGYTCPDVRKYPDQFFWDSCFHALAWSRFDPTRAMRELRTLAEAQQPSGMIGHTVFWHGPCRLSRAYTYNMIDHKDRQTATIQPPLLAWMWAEVAERAGDAAFAEEGVEVLTRYHEYLDATRGDADGLIGVLQPDETGLDASPMFDVPLGWHSHPMPGFLLLQNFNRKRGYDYRRVVKDGGFHATDVLTNTAWALAWEGMARLGVSGAARRSEEVTGAIVKRLYDPVQGFFYAEGPNGERLDMSTWSGLSPLALPHLPVDIANRVVDDHLLNPQRYWLAYPVPSTSASEPAFVAGIDRFLWIERYWRGPTWPFTTWFILRGLLRLGRQAEAAHLVDRTATLVQKAGFREYYNPRNGRGYGARSFGVSTMVVECMSLLNAAMTDDRAIA